MADEVYEEALAGLDPEQRATLMSGLATIVENLGGTDCAPAGTARAGTEGTDE